MANEFKPGDVVRLKSGGPKMTVTRADNDICSCAWFHGAEITSHDFYADSLETVPAGGSTAHLGVW